MCGRYSITTAPDAMRRLFGFDELPNLKPRYNMAPTQAAPVVRPKGEGRQLTFMRWGLIPSWSKELGSGQINARSESVAEKPSFRAAFQRRRCLVPADGFYEWRKVGSEKQPYRIFLEDDQVFAIAGIWEQWQSPDGSELESFAVLTTEANEAIEFIHHRMPVILDPSDYERWLNGEAADLAPLMRPAPADKMRFHPISSMVNKPANDDAGLWQPVEELKEKKPEPPKQGSLF